MQHQPSVGQARKYHENFTMFPFLHSIARRVGNTGRSTEIENSASVSVVGVTAAATPSYSAPHRYSYKGVNQHCLTPNFQTAVLSPEFSLRI